MPLKSRLDVIIAEYKLKHGKVKKKDIAESVGITQQYLSEIIANRAKNVDTEILFKLAKVLGCKVDDLYVYEEENKQ